MMSLMYFDYSFNKNTDHIKKELKKVIIKISDSLQVMQGNVS